MVTRSIEFVTNEHYHVYNRGNSKQNIFHSHSDYQRFLYLLYLCNSTENVNIRNILRSKDDVFSVDRGDPLVKIHAFCLMPNHYHLLLTPCVDEGLSIFMLKLGTGYSMFFNTKYERTGSLFESRFKAKHADYDEYLKYLFTYIHLNPIPKSERGQTKSFEKALQYPYSSMVPYFNVRVKVPRAALGIKQIIDTELLSMYLPNQEQRYQEILDWLNFDPDFLV